MYETQKPEGGRSQRITCTGFANAVRGTGGSVKQVLIKARDAVAGMSDGDLASNTNPVIVYFGEEGVGTVAHTGYSLQPGEAITVAISDTNMIYVRGTSGDSVNVITLV